MNLGPDCPFLIQNLGEGSFNTVKEHVALCTQCQEEIKENFEIYQGYPELHSALPEGIVSEEDFLRAWHFSLVQQGDAFEHFLGLLRAKLPPNVELLVRLFAAQARSLNLIGKGAPQEFYENEYKIMEKRYRELIAGLGEGEANLLLDIGMGLGVSSLSLEDILQGWRVIYNLDQAS